MNEQVRVSVQVGPNVLPEFVALNGKVAHKIENETGNEVRAVPFRQ